MDPLLTAMRRFIASRRLLDGSGRRVVVGLSGGPDSVALLAALTRLGYRCVAAHCHYGLRGAESDRDRNHALGIARSLGAEWRETAFDTRAYCRLHSLGLEEGCRELRYGWFHTLARELDAQAIAVAHHRADRIETMLINLLRGTGLSGLRGIRPRNGMVVRPLLGATRRQIDAFLLAEGLEGVTDSSNLADDFLRNRLRHNVVPALRLVAGPGRDADSAIIAT